jgi:hypothetical protein
MSEDEKNSEAPENFDEDSHHPQEIEAAPDYGSCDVNDKDVDEKWIHPSTIDDTFQTINWYLFKIHKKLFCR